MEITTTKIYEKALAVEKGKATGVLCRLISMDISITGLKYPGDIETLRTCLARWNEEFEFGSTSENGNRQDVPPSPEEKLSVEETILRERICRKVCEYIERAPTKKYPISVCNIYTLILIESGCPVHYPDKPFGILLDVIRRLRPQGYSFDWDSKVLYDAYQARTTLSEVAAKEVPENESRKEACHE